MAQAIDARQSARSREGAVARGLDRSLIDRLISWAGAVVAIALLLLGAAAIFGGSFALDNVRDRLEPQAIAFPPADAMTAQESAEVGTFAGEEVDTGTEAEAYSRYIGIHLNDIGGGMTYAELGGVQRELEADIESASASAVPQLEEELASITAQRETVFKGETLRAILLNAYGWWMVGQITLFAGIGLVVVGLLLGILVLLGFRHARRIASQA